MIRDKLRNREYFDLYIEEERDDINWYCNKLNKGEVTEDRILPVKKGILSAKINCIIAQYSRGDSVHHLMKSFDEIFHDFKELGAKGVTHTYSENLRIVSLSVLFDITKEKICDFNGMTLYQDSLMNFLINGEMTDEISKENLQRKDYSMLYELIFMADKEKQSEQLKTFVNDIWYKTNDEMGWYEAHKETKVNIYNGYWCFEAAAVAKLLNIPDDNLKDSQYYPYDLAHFEG